MSWPEWLGYDSLAHAKQLEVPTMLIHSDNAALPMNVKAIYEALPGNKELVWSTDGHLDFYDRPDLVDRSADAADLHFDRSL